MADESLDATDEVVYEPSREFVESTNVWAFMEEFGIADYEELIERTTTDVPGEPESGIEWFWDVLPEYLGIEFFEAYDRVRDDADGPQFSEWYPGGTINVAHNVLDRHARVDEPARNDAALIWEGEDGTIRTWTFRELDRQASKVANALDARGVEVGDTVGVYMPMVPAVVAVLYGCLKLGAIAVPIFSGFGADAVATRLADAEPAVLFTADGFYRRGETVRLKETADEAIAATGSVEHTIVYGRLGGDTALAAERDEAWHEAVSPASDEFAARELPASQESLLLYSSGTTGEPKGIVHTHAGVLLQCAKEIYFGFDHRPADRFFWVSDVGWMMGPWSLIGNHAFGGTVFAYEGAPDYPDPDRYWRMIDRHDLSVFGVSPTAIRSLRKRGDEWLAGHDLSSLRLLGSTGEPWDPESWRWFFEEVGGGDAPILNVSGGTEICGCFLMPMPIQPLKPCTLGGPGLGMAVDVVNAEGESVVESGERGYLVARDSCPSTTKSLWSGDERYLDEYWSTWEDRWDHGDWARVDDDGFWFLHGRADDALNVAGRKVGPAEVEGAAMDHPAVNQAAAVGVPDDTTGTAVVLYVVVEPDSEESGDLRTAIGDRVAASLGKPFRPSAVRFVDRFPKTQSGKVLRRVVRAVHVGEDPGDLGSIADPSAVDDVAGAR